MNAAWRCNDCLMANRPDEDACFWCGSTNKVVLRPVKIPNQLQGTPGYDELQEVMHREESHRKTDKTFEELKAERIAAWKREKKWPN